MTDRRVWRKIVVAIKGDLGRRPRSGDIAEADGSWWRVTDPGSRSAERVELRDEECSCGGWDELCTACDGAGNREEWVAVG